MSGDRNFFSGSIVQIEKDFKAMKGFEPDELILDVTFSPDSQKEEGCNVPPQEPYDTVGLDYQPIDPYE